MYQQATAFECELLRQHYEIAHTSLKKREKRKWRIGIGSVNEWTVKVDEAEAEVLYFLQYRYNDTSWKDMEEIMRRAKLVVINFGVHWLIKDEYEASMRQLFEFLNEGNYLGTHQIVWRETFSQHFENEGGEWAKELKLKSSPCVGVELETVSRTCGGKLSSLALYGIWEFLYIF